MYRFDEKQLSFTGFNQPQGLQMNHENRWIKKAEMISWDTVEKEYAKLFPSRTDIIAMNIDCLASMLLRILKFIFSFFVFDNRKVKVLDSVTY